MEKKMADFLYAEYSRAFCFQEDFRCLSSPQSDLKSSAQRSSAQRSSAQRSSAQQASKKLREGNRKSDKLARICRYTRAIFELNNTPMPRKKTHGQMFKRGFEHFLEYAYGNLFERGKYWYNNPDPFLFIKFLFKLASGGKFKLKYDKYVTLFYKTNTISSAKWKVDIDALRSTQIEPKTLMQTIFNFREQAP